MEITVNGLKINYRQFGQGEDLLILHGWGYGITLLEPFARILSNNYRVTLADMPGHGGSPEPSAPITVYDYAETVNCLLDTLNIEKTYVLGHSFGCRLSVILASKHPEKVKRMILCGAAGIRPKRSAKYYFKTYSYKCAKFFLKTFAPEKIESWRKTKGSEDYRNLSDSMKATFSNVVNEDLTYLLKDIKAPVFLIWGELDTATPLYMADIFEKEIKDCAKTVYKNRTHYAFLEETPRTVAIVNTFFKEQ